MANHKSSKKRILITEKKNAINTSRRSRVKTFIKKAIKAITGGDKTEATAAMRTAESHIMKCAGKTMPKKRASRKVSRMTKKVNTIA